jgi:hypothetical protein
MINHVLRQDLAEGVDHISIFARLVNERFIVKLYAQDQWSSIFPSSKCLWRGGGLPEKHCRFFEQVGKKFRVPGFFATSRKMEVAMRFMKTQTEYPVLWMILLLGLEGESERNCCLHLSYVEKSHYSQSEEEFLFPPYSAFQIVRMQRLTSKGIEHLVITIR